MHRETLKVLVQSVHLYVTQQQLPLLELRYELKYTAFVTMTTTVSL